MCCNFPHILIVLSLLIDVKPSKCHLLIAFDTHTLGSIYRKSIVAGRDFSCDGTCTIVQ